MKIIKRILSLALIMSLMLGIVACSDDENETSQAPYLNFGAAGGGTSAVGLDLTSDESTQTFTLRSNGSWKITGTASWMTISPDQGTGDAEVSFTVEKNILTEKRSAKFTCLLNDKELRPIYVAQAAFTPKIEITPAMPVISSSSGTITFEIESEVAWTYSNRAAWLTEVEKTDSTLTLSVAENTGNYERQINLTFTLPEYSYVTKQIPVKQTDIWGRKGLWQFEDGNLGKATTGQDLIPVGDGISWLNDGPSSILGVNNNAVRVLKGTYYRCNHDIPATEGSLRVVNYTLMFDIRVSSFPWHAFYHTNLERSGDATIWINGSGAIGVGATNYSGSVITVNTWNRVIITRTASTINYYCNGTMAKTSATTDNRFNLDPAGVLFFADCCSYDGDIDVAEVAIWDRELSAEEVARLGVAGNE
jgi:hypothetical protein